MKNLKHLMTKIKSLDDPEFFALIRGETGAPKNNGHDVVMVSGDVVDVYIYDVIAYPWIEAQDIVNQIPAGTNTINLHINSPGGSVWEGMTIYNWLSSHPAQKNAYIEGLAASMASVIPMVADNITIYDSAYVMIHNPWVSMSGNAGELTHEATLLKKIEGTMADIYSARTGVEKDRVQAWMDGKADGEKLGDGTYFSGVEAKGYGFADEVKEETALAGIKFDLSMFGPRPKQRAATARTTEPTEVDEMDKKLRERLEALGLDKGATDEQAYAFLSTELDKGTDLPDEETVRAQEKDRQKEIRRRVAVVHLPDEFAQKLIDDDVPTAEISDKVFAEMERVNPPVGSGRVDMGADDRDKFRAAAVDALALRSGQRIEKPAPGARDLMGHEMTTIIKESLSRAGVNVSQLHSRMQVADFVFRSRQGSLTRSDFPEIFRDAANKSLQRAYQEAPATWRPWVNVTTVSDFKDKYVAALSEAPDLKKVKEAEEYTYGKLLEKGEKYAPEKYGRIIRLTWEMLVDDDLNAFTRQNIRMGNAAARLESDVVYNLLTGGSGNHGPTLTDTVQFFHADRGNLLTDGKTITAANLDAARQKMRAQTGLKKSRLNISPRFLLLGPKNQMTAEILIGSSGNTTDEKSAAVVNPMYNRFQIIVEDRMSDIKSGEAWYIIADPAQIDTFEVSYLTGYTAPDISEREGFETDSIEWKIRHVFGAGAIEPRAFVMNDATA